jgi:hypothetical protein
MLMNVHFALVFCSLLRILLPGLCRRYSPFACDRMGFAAPQAGFAAVPAIGVLLRCLNHTGAFARRIAGALIASALIARCGGISASKPRMAGADR